MENIKKFGMYLLRKERKKDIDQYTDSSGRIEKKIQREILGRYLTKDQVKTLLKIEYGEKYIYGKIKRRYRYITGQHLTKEQDMTQKRRERERRRARKRAKRNRKSAEVGEILGRYLPKKERERKRKGQINRQIVQERKRKTERDIRKVPN